MGVGGGFHSRIRDMQSSQMSSGCPMSLCMILGLQSSQILGNLQLLSLQSSQMSGSSPMVPEGSMGSSARGVSVLGSAMGA